MHPLSKIRDPKSKQNLIRIKNWIFQGFFTVGNEMMIAGRKCLLLADLDEFLQDAEHSGQL